MPSILESLSRFTHGTFLWLLVDTHVMSLLSLVKDFVLRNCGEIFFALRATFFPFDHDGLGLVFVSYWALLLSM